MFRSHHAREIWKRNNKPVILDVFKENAGREISFIKTYVINYPKKQSELYKEIKSLNVDTKGEKEKSHYTSI